MGFEKGKFSKLCWGEIRVRLGWDLVVKIIVVLKMVWGSYVKILIDFKLESDVMCVLERGLIVVD